MKIPIVKYEEHKHLIQNADVLLFRHSNFPKFGWWISKYTFSRYSHAGLAYWQNDDLYILEFREFHGGRIYPLVNYLKKGCDIDVFRCVDVVSYPVVSTNPKLNVHNIYKRFTTTTQNNILYTAGVLVGKPYSWWTIWQLAKNFIPFIRLKQPLYKNGETDPQSFVCSTLVSYAYRVNFMDPVPFLEDNKTTPGDLARSRLFFKIFEIISTKK